MFISLSATYVHNKDRIDLVAQADTIGHADSDLDLAIAGLGAAVDGAIAEVEVADEHEQYSDIGFVFDDLDGDGDLVVWDGALYSRPHPASGVHMALPLGELRSKLMAALHNKAKWRAVRRYGQAVGMWAVTATVHSSEA